MFPEIYSAIASIRSTATDVQRDLLMIMPSLEMLKSCKDVKFWATLKSSIHLTIYFKFFEPSSTMQCTPCTPEQWLPTISLLFLRPQKMKKVRRTAHPHHRKLHLHSQCRLRKRSPRQNKIWIQKTVEMTTKETFSLQWGLVVARRPCKSMMNWRSTTRRAV